MARTALLFAGAMAAISMLSDASAQSWSLGVEIGGPHYPPPPVYLYGRPPVVYAPAPPPVVYAPAPPVYYQPAPPVLHSSLSPEGIFDALEDAGYSDFGPMAFRDGVYKLQAVNAHGELVGLEVSALDGVVENEYPLDAGVIAPRRLRAPHAAAAPAGGPPPRRQQPRPAAGGDPLVVY